MKNSRSVLLDTNVLVYNQDRDSEFYGQAAEYHALAETGEIQAVIAAQNLLEFSAVMMNPKRVVRPLSQKEASDEVGKYLASKRFGIIYPDEMTVTYYLELMGRYSLDDPRDVFDMFLVATMLGSGVSRIVTANVRDFGFAEVEVVDLANA